MSKLRVGVLRGGPSSEYDVSLASGKNVLSELSENKYEIKDILIDKDGVWHFRGVPKSPPDVLQQIDLAFLALHGEYGEDGTVQRLLDQFAVPYTGSRAMPSAFSMNKALTKERMKKRGFLVPEGRVISVTTDARDQIENAMRHMGFPLIVKPNAAGSSVGVTVAHNQDELVEGVRRAFEFGSKVIIEDYIDGREATCGVIENFRGEKLYSLLPIEIIADHDEGLFDYQAKYSGKSKEICPGNFTQIESRKLQEIAKTAHEEMELSHYSRSDFMISPKGVYFLEVNTLPGLTKESLLPKSINAVGSSLPEFFDHIIGLAKR